MAQKRSEHNGFNELKNRYDIARLVNMVDKNLSDIIEVRLTLAKHDQAIVGIHELIERLSSEMNAGMVRLELKFDRLSDMERALDRDSQRLINGGIKELEERVNKRTSYIEAEINKAKYAFIAGAVGVITLMIGIIGYGLSLIFENMLK